MPRRPEQKAGGTSSTVPMRTTPYFGASVTSTHTPFVFPEVKQVQPHSRISGIADFHVWTVSYNPHQTACFGDVARNVVDSLRQLGYSVEETSGAMPVGRGGQFIVLGANILKNLALIPHNAIIYQLEQFGSRWITPPYMHLLQTHIVWDFSAHNADKLRGLGCSRLHLCRIGASPQQPVQQPSSVKDIDVFFYGSKNDRRKAVLAALRSRGVNIHDGDAWGSDRYSIIARSKIVLNIHYYADAVLEMVRLAPAIEQKAFVVSEIGADSKLESVLSGGIVLAPYDKLVDTVIAELAKTQAERDAIATQGAQAFASLPHKGEVERCINESVPHIKPKRVKCYINNRNRLTWTQNIVREIVRLGGEPIIIDNASTYPPLLAWYESGCSCRVVRLNENAGARAPWISGTLDRELQQGELYVVTDPDLDLSGVPADALTKLARGLDKYNVRKAGLSLEINDVPRELLDIRQVNNLTLEEIESGYWKTRLDSEFWSAATDTTFAMYRHGGPVKMDGSFYSGVRADRPYTAKHLPWYRLERDFDDEDTYYVAHRQVTAVNGNWYDSVKGEKK